MRRWRPCFPLVLIACLASSVLAQSELVIYKEGTTLYHRPGCPTIRDTTAVVAMSRAQAESRGYKPHGECDPAQQPAAAQGRGLSTGADAKPASPVTVYLDGTKYYHRKDCAKLTAASKPAVAQSLEAAGKTHWPCPTCKPPVRRKTTEPAVPGMGRRGR